jgi:asparagine synthase (glutamine-hydrolysing)
MVSCLVHRGPDDQGVWVDPEAGVALGHRRLSILDLSAEGHQPMVSHDERWVVAFNGEIYNFALLRQELEGRGHKFRGHSDTEVLLASVSEWGVEAAVRRWNGMFALALWDRVQRDLWLLRDRFGEKPLYYGFADGVFLFGSELKAFREHPGFAPSIDRDSLSLFFRFGYVPSPRSIYCGINKLLPGSLLRFRPGQTGASPMPYWSAREVLEGAASRAVGPEEAVEALGEILTDAVAIRMVADVPIGAFLSGGIDSSTVVALMQETSSRPVRTFSIGFTEAAYDEAPQARAVADHLGTDHTELYVTPQEAQAAIPLLPGIYDEPFADSSQIPTYLVSQMARQHVTVALSGDGGDELFAGYDRYRWTPRLWALARSAPAPLRRGIARALTARSPEGWDALLRRRRIGSRLHRVSGLLDAPDPFDLYVRLLGHGADPADIVVGGLTPPTRLTDPAERAGLPLVGQLAHLDMISYLPDDILTKVDRASMAVSLEVRIPLLDPRILELAGRIPVNVKGQRGITKWPLRALLRRYVPPEMFERPKMGFGVPVAQWLRGPLHEWAADLLDERRLRSEGYLLPELLGTAWREHLAGRGEWGPLLWDALMFQAWLEHAKP